MAIHGVHCCQGFPCKITILFYSACPLLELQSFSHIAVLMPNTGYIPNNIIKKNSSSCVYPINIYTLYKKELYFYIYNIHYRVNNVPSTSDTDAKSRTYRITKSYLIMYSLSRYAIVILGRAPKSCFPLNLHTLTICIWKIQEGNSLEKYTEVFFGGLQSLLRNGLKKPTLWEGLFITYPPR